MKVNQYLVYALLIAACIPVLEVVATWYYMRGYQRRQKPTADGWLLPNDFPVEETAIPTTTPLPSLSREFEALSAASAEAVQRLGIGFDGRQFTYAGSTYDRASDAIAYAEMVTRKTKELRDGPLGPPVA